MEQLSRIGRERQEPATRLDRLLTPDSLHEAASSLVSGTFDRASIEKFKQNLFDFYTNFGNHIAVDPALKRL